MVESSVGAELFVDESMKDEGCGKKSCVRNWDGGR